MLVMIDNYDSFTYNVVQYLAELGAEVRVFRNDEITVAELAELDPDHLVISPGPGRPEAAGVSVAAVKAFAGRGTPVLGVCLGHQAIGEAFGGRIGQARTIMHGKISPIHHDSSCVFEGLPTPFDATRYHSLVVARDSVPDCLEVSAWTTTEAGEVDEIMGLRHRELAVEGVQFHPESVLSEHGHALLENFLRMGGSE